LKKSILELFILLIIQFGTDLLRT